MFYLLLLTIIITMIFISLNHPLMLNIVVVVQTINVALIMFMEKLNPWFSYLLFMVFLSGMMIIFIYISSLASNEPFSKMSFSFSMLTLSITFVTLSFIFSLYSKNLNQNLFNSSMSTISDEIYKPYQMMMNSMTTLMILYLLIVLIIVVNISKKAKTSLRMKK